MSRSPQDLRAGLNGLLSFPVTPFTPDDEIDENAWRQHLEYQISASPAALFVCGGTGEFYSLAFDEFRVLVKAAVEQVRGRVPIIAGIGGGVKMASELARAAESAGVDGVMAFPPYLVDAEQEGLFQYYRTVAAATRLGVIIYQRDKAIFAPETVRRLAAINNVIALKDGHGDVERLTRIRLELDNALVLLNGMPTAELSAQAMRGAGASIYSSAVFNFVPEVARAFYDALSSGNDPECDRLLNGFYRPFGQLRDRGRGFAVSLIKAGVSIRLRPVGRARPPLSNPSPEIEDDLRLLIARGLALLPGSESKQYTSHWPGA